MSNFYFIVIVKYLSVKMVKRRSRRVTEQPIAKVTRPPYVVVLYHGHKSKGVVVTEKIPVDAEVGSVVMAPDPIDLPDNGKTREKVQSHSG